MKKRTILLIALSFVLVLAGCAQAQSDSISSNGNSGNATSVSMTDLTAVNRNHTTSLPDPLSNFNAWTQRASGSWNIGSDTQNNSLSNLTGWTGRATGPWVFQTAQQNTVDSSAAISYFPPTGSWAR